VTINGRGKDRSPKGLADNFQDLWYDDLVQAQAIRASFLLESNAGFDRCSPHSLGLGDNGLRCFPSPLSSLLERGLFEPEQGEGQKWGQRESKYTTVIGTQLLAKIHVLDNKIGRVDRQQNHPVNHLDEHVDFIGDAADRVGKVVDELNGRIDCQDVQITGGKGWCPDPVHHKYIARKWTKDLANTHPEYSKDIQNFPSQFK
jgi:hypothetical protein